MEAADAVEVAVDAAVVAVDTARAALTDVEQKLERAKAAAADLRMSIAPGRQGVMVPPTEHTT